MLDDWLAWLEQLHPKDVDLGLERVGAVATAMGVREPRARVITVAGTNGKGSVCALVASVLQAAGYRVGLYTSPHIARFNERVRVNGQPADDDALERAFERVERARGGTSLTYFEFTTLAALAHFASTGVDYLVLEVGLGGRLDATNLIDADVAVVTSIALDHAEWLGGDRDSIAREKAGIARPDRPLIVGEPRPPAALLHAVGAIGARISRAGVDFDWMPAEQGWRWCGVGGSWVELPIPGTGGGYQLSNAATAVAAAEALGFDPRGPAAPAIEAGLREASVPGRFEVIPGAVEVILDVAHNPAAAAALTGALRQRDCEGRTLGVIAMYHDKDIDGVVEALAPAIDRWFPAGLPGARGARAGRLVGAIAQAGGVVARQCEEPLAAFEAARAAARGGDRVVVAGSFATVGPIRARLEP